MKIRYFEIFVITSIVIIALGQDKKAFDSALEISVEKNHFFKHENIWVKFRIENKGEIGPRIVGNKYDYWIVTDEKGTKYRRFFL